MPRGPTNVNRLTNNIDQANREWRNAMSRLWGPRWMGGFSRSMAPNPSTKREWLANINAARERRNALMERLRHMNKNALQVRSLKLNNRASELIKRLGNISRNLNAIPRNNAARRVPLAREFKRLKQEQKEVINDTMRLKRAINMRKKVLARKMSPSRAARVIQTKFKNVFYVPNNAGVGLRGRGYRMAMARMRGNNASQVGPRERMMGVLRAKLENLRHARNTGNRGNMVSIYSSMNNVWSSGGGINGANVMDNAQKIMFRAGLIM